MLFTRCACILGVVVTTCALGTSLQAQDEYSTTLQYKVTRNWKVILPNETWTPAEGIPVAHSEGQGFHTRKEGMTLLVDSDGDGKTDQKVKGTKGHVVLRAKREDGTTLTYAVRVRYAGKAYEFSASGSMSGSVLNVPLQVIDQNNNGIYNEYGIDAMVVGNGRAASFLSRVVNLKGQLYDFDVTADGSTVTVKTHQGPGGTLNVRSGLNLPGKVLSAVVSTGEGDVSFEVAGASSGLLIPTGSYTFTGGFARQGGDTARLAAGKMKAIVIKEDEVSSIAWGAPVIAEFNFTRAGDKLTVQPEVTFLGRAGERWHTLLPDAKSPRLAFYDKQRDALLATKRFEGC